MSIPAYIYPITNRFKKGLYNPYLDDFIAATEGEIQYVNKEKPSNIGLFNLLPNIFKTKLLFLNWIENLPEKKLGLLQSLFLLFILYTKKVLGIKVVWTMHNRISHSQKYFFLKKLLFSQLVKKSDTIITHSTEGIEIAKSIKAGAESKIFYFPHPIVAQKQYEESSPKKYDILIWGTLSPYKGVDMFLEHLKNNGLLNTYKILIVGKSVSEEFFATIQQYQNDTITIRNEFIEKKDLITYINQSRIVLFTYLGGSVLSSGALIDSLAHHANVVGPDAGAFKEFEDMGIVKTFKNYHDLTHILSQQSHKNSLEIEEKIKYFVDMHSWNKFAQCLISYLKNK